LDEIEKTAGGCAGEVFPVTPRIHAPVSVLKAACPSWTAIFAFQLVFTGPFSKNTKTTANLVFAELPNCLQGWRARPGFRLQLCRRESVGRSFLVVAQLRPRGGVDFVMPLPDVAADYISDKAVSPSSRERILLAAKHLFARNGYENTSTVAIARDAGTSESQLMKHFGSKQGLLAAILDRGWAAIVERVQALGQRSGADRLVGMLEAIVVELEQDQELKDMMTLETHRVRKDGRDVLVSRGFRQFVELFDATLSDLRREGQLRDDLNPEAMRTALIGLTESLLRGQVVAQRSELRAGYSFEDVSRILRAVLPAFTGVPPQFRSGRP
jgi:AcrR family transcriptional regulator